MKISIILPSISPNKWVNLFEMIKKSVGDYTFEVLASGPSFPPIELQKEINFRYIREFSSPSRSFMAAANLAIGKYIMWFPDDSIITEGAIKQCLDILEEKGKKNAIISLYSEGPNFSGTQHLESERWYWTAYNHADQKLRWINKDWKIAPLFIYNLEEFKELGGLDCSFYHINMNAHSLAFRFQSEGGSFHFSPTRVSATDWHPWVGSEGEVIRIAYETNDLPKYKKMWDSETPPTLDWKFDNWKEASVYWELRFK